MEKATKRQIEIAKIHDISIDESSFRIAAAQIYEELIDVFEYEYEIEPATQKQKEFAEDLGIDVSNDSKSLANTKISVAVDKQNWERIEKLGLEPGVKVRYKKGANIFGQTTHVISSISDNARLWFKGGQGKGAFPHEIELVNKS